jgi:hypothetical protein
MTDYATGEPVEDTAAFPFSAQATLRLARETLDSARGATVPEPRYALAYLGALRGAAALLALHGHPVRSRVRPTDVWTLLAREVPEWAEWAPVFSAASATRAAILAGIAVNVTPALAVSLLHEAEQFVALVGQDVER